MKTLFTLLAAALLLGTTAFICLRPRPTAALVSLRPVAAAPARAAGPTVRRLARSAEAGHVADVMVWSSGRVVKGQPLARLSIPVSTPALRLAQRAVAAAAAAHEARPNAESDRALALARTRLAEVPRFERDAYVLAPATGRLVRSLLVNGQYLPRAGAAAIIEVPAPARPSAPEALALR